MPLLLVPNLLGDTADPKMNFVIGLHDKLQEVDGFFVENAKNTRKFLKHFDFNTHRDKPMEVVNKRTDEFEDLLKPVVKGETWAMISDAGVPCVADPGTKLVMAARKKGISVEAIVGPCSILLALMLSGLPSQRFIFQGYAPRQMTARIREPGITQVFIETPYNNAKTLEAFMENLHDRDFLSIAVDLTLPSQEVHTHTIKEWKRKKVSIQKRPAIFLAHSSLA